MNKIGLIKIYVLVGIFLFLFMYFAIRSYENFSIKFTAPDIIEDDNFVRFNTTSLFSSISVLDCVKKPKWYIDMKLNESKITTKYPILRYVDFDNILVSNFYIKIHAAYKHNINGYLPIVYSISINDGDFKIIKPKAEGFTYIGNIKSNQRVYFKVRVCPIPNIRVNTKYVILVPTFRFEANPYYIAFRSLVNTIYLTVLISIFYYISSRLYKLYLKIKSRKRKNRN